MVLCALGYDTDVGVTEDSTLPCFAASGEQTATQLRERFQQALTHSLVVEHVDRLIDTSLGSTWTRLYDSVSVATFPFRRTWISLCCAVSILFAVHFVITRIGEQLRNRQSHEINSRYCKDINTELLKDTVILGQA